MGLYDSPYDHVIHTVLIATLCASLITSFQPPLGCRLTALNLVHVSPAHILHTGHMPKCHMKNQPSRTNFKPCLAPGARLLKAFIILWMSEATANAGGAYACVS